MSGFSFGRLNGSRLMSRGTSVVALLITVASVLTVGVHPAVGAPSGPQLNDTRAVLGTGSPGQLAQQLCPGDVIVQQGAPVTSGSNDGVSWTTGQETAFPYPPSGLHYAGGSIPYVGVTVTSPDVTIGGVLVNGGGSGGSAYQFYSDPSSLPPNGTQTSSVPDGTATSGSAGGFYYTPPINTGGNAPVLSGVSICLGQPKLSPTLVTTANPSGTSATDGLLLTVPAGGGTPTGTVTFTLTNDTTNSTFGSQSGVTLTAGATSGTYTATSQSFTGLTPGDTYTFTASYVPGTNDIYGPANDTGAPSETFTVPGAAVTTTIYSGGSSVNGAGSGGLPVTGSLLAPASVYDTATVSGNAGTPTGYVAFTLYAGVCSDGGSVIVPEIASNPLYSVVAQLINGVATTDVTTDLAAGSYYFVSQYLGGGTYGPQTGPCEPFTVVTPSSPPPSSPPPPTTPSLLSVTISTTPNPSGSSASDSATVAGSGTTPTGTVTFTLYSSNGQVVGTDTESLNGGNASSTTFSGLAAGSYYFVATYNGDTTYAAAVGSQEPFTVVSVSPSPTPKPKKPKPYRIPAKSPTTGFGGTAHTQGSGLLGVISGLLVLMGLAGVAEIIRRRRNA